MNFKFFLHFVVVILYTGLQSLLKSCSWKTARNVKPNCFHVQYDNGSGNKKDTYTLYVHNFANKLYINFFSR